jgi:type IX secretion system PorP/SprF family membrane protein
MFKNLKLILFGLTFCLFVNGFSQQDEQSSMYMFNPLQFNPAYAGSRGDLSVTGIVRSQWIGIKGAPRSQFLSMNTPLKYKNMGIGMHISNDAIGAKNRTSFYADYAYTLNFKNGNKLNLGLSFGGEQFSVDYMKLIAQDPTETDYLVSFSQFKFNSGVGAYYFSDKFYAGISSPRIFETRLENNGIVLSENFTKRHYFIAAGYVHPINTVVDLKTSTLIKIAPNAPITVDLNANLFLYKMFWVGGMYRLHESAGLNLAYQVKEALMFGYAFDFPINGLNAVNNMGSHEFMLNYTISHKKKAFGSPRYF